MKIDFNADLGETESIEGMESEAAFMPFISSCNIACGGHAGSMDTMRTMVSAAKEYDVRVGAHPSYPDRQNFGRKSIEMDIDQLSRSLAQQILALQTIADDLEWPLSHLKPHGALYNDAQDNAELAGALARLADRYHLMLVGMPASKCAQAAARLNVPFVPEGFVDRRYMSNGRLQSRQERGAVLETQKARQQQALALAQGMDIATADGGPIAIHVQTLCLHADSPGAIDSAKALCVAFENAGIAVAAPVAAA